MFNSCYFSHWHSECGQEFQCCEALTLNLGVHPSNESLSTDLRALIATMAGTSAMNQKQHHHVNQQHNSQQKVSVPMPKQKYFCTNCRKGYAAKHGLLQHKRRNSNGSCALRTHVCECGKAFFQKNHLMLHQRLSRRALGNGVIDCMMRQQQVCAICIHELIRCNLQLHNLPYENLEHSHSRHDSNRITQFERLFAF